MTEFMQQKSLLLQYRRQLRQMLLSVHAQKNPRYLRDITNIYAECADIIEPLSKTAISYSTYQWIRQWIKSIHNHIYFYKLRVDKYLKIGEWDRFLPNLPIRRCYPRKEQAMVYTAYRLAGLLMWMLNLDTVLFMKYDPSIVAAIDKLVTGTQTRS